MTGCASCGRCYLRAIVGTAAKYAAMKADPACASCGTPTAMCCADCVLRSGGQVMVPVCARQACLDAHLAEHRCDGAAPAPAALMAVAPP